jgi:hypothetical protein
MSSYRCSKSAQPMVSAHLHFLSDLPSSDSTHATLVYYRLYSTTKQLPSKYRVYSNSQYIGRIDATCIPPPHNARSIKRCIASHEEIVDHTTEIILFSALSSQDPMGDQDFVPILAGTAPGSTPQEPMALVIADASDIVNANKSIKDGTYIISNPDKGCVWNAGHNPIQNIYLLSGTMDNFRVITAIMSSQVSLSS